ncbi:saccharopine dehydrogenase family protein [Massilia glaciei]|uniref:Saccharopine dehydrogenase n=1 Tax=Massilia glaciei TaxID=1524097 RepID=A0A2U2HM62_9BURK|nr:saccharopine dehydrogenase NADP-binding domain-containing protein [Massilia glaciei]PWF48515.1 saccharopine dehydrogenase [Massilia glaciei]
MSKPPQYDVIVFGATSFVGQILCRVLTEQCAGQFVWAAAGRSRSKLEQVRAQLGPAGVGVPLIVADAASADDMRALCARARLVVSTVGPYALYGEQLVKACAQTGTDYCDLTGEVQWVRRMIECYQDSARASGARIVHCCGFDSIPSDLGVRFLQREARQRFGQPCTSVKMRVKAMAGTVSGGTCASLVNIAREAAADPAVRRELADPYSICPPGHGLSARQNAAARADYDADFKTWTAPFLMAGINTRVVHRSNALLNAAYGREFTYDEATMAKGWLRAQGFTLGIGAFMLALGVAPLRGVIERRVLPQPGEGPSPEAQAKGFFDFRFLGTTAHGPQLRVKVTGDRDPGYGSTARMLAQAAACLLLDVPRTERGGGFWTPATVFGDKLIARLEAHAGLRFTVLEA